MAQSENQTYSSFYLFNKDVKRFTNKNGNDFVTLNIDSNEKEATFITLSEKLVKAYDLAKEPGKVFTRSTKENDKAPFINISIPNGSELTVSIKNKETAEFRKEVVSLEEVFDKLKEISLKTTAWAKEAIEKNANKDLGTPSVNKEPIEFELTEELPDRDDDEILWAD